MTFICVYDGSKISKYQTTRRGDLACKRQFESNFWNQGYQVQMDQKCQFAYQNMPDSFKTCWTSRNRV